MPAAIGTYSVPLLPWNTARKPLTVIKDKVDTSQLLKGLQSHSSEQSLADGLLETRYVRRCSNGHLIFMVRFDFGKFLEKDGMVHRESTEARKGFCRFVVSASLDEIARCFRKDQHPNNQDNCLFVEVSDVETLSNSLQKSYPSK